MKKKLSLLMVALVAVAAFAGLRRADDGALRITFGDDAESLVSLQDEYADGAFKLSRTDENGKHGIAANNAWFGDATAYEQLHSQLKTGGKSGSKNALTLTIPADGTLKVYVRTASNDATDRNLVLTQGETELFNQVVQQSDAIEVAMNPEEPDTKTKVYPIVSVAVQAGTVAVGYPNGALNFYGFEFVPAAVEDSDYYVVGSMNEWAINDDYKLTLNEEAGEGIVEYMLTKTFAANDELKVKSSTGTWYPDGENNNYVITEAGEYTVYFRPAGNDAWDNHYFYVAKNEVLNTYTATFTNNGNWAEVYAYAWTTKEEVTTEFLGTWPGTKLEASDAGYVATIQAAAAPEKIIFTAGANGPQTADLDFVDGGSYSFEAPAEDVDVYPEAGADIAAAVAAACEGKNVGNLKIELAKEAAYTFNSTIELPGSLTFNGNDAVIDASALEGPMFQMVTLPESAEWKKADVNIAGITVKGLKKTLFYSNSKNYLFENFIVTWVNVELAGDATTFDFTKGSAAQNFLVTNSTFYAPTATTKAFYSSQSGQKATDAGVEIQFFEFQNNTMFNLATGKNFFTHRSSNQTWLTYNVKYNIFVNCGKKGQVIKGMNGGQSGPNPTWVIEGNLFNFDVTENEVTTRVDTSGEESTGDEEEPVKASVKGVVTFTDEANGDFNGEVVISEGEAVPEHIGPLYWTIGYKMPEPEFPYTVAGAFYYGDPATEVSVFGPVAWDASNPEGDMVKGDDGIYRWKKEDVELQIGTLAFKVVKNHDWDQGSYPENNYEVSTSAEGAYDIEITFNPSTTEVSAVLTPKFTPTEDTYTVAGAYYYGNPSTEVAIFGTAWDPTNTAGDMTKGEDGIYTWTKEGVDLEAGTLNYKVVKNHSWDENWGMPEKQDGNAEYIVNESGKYDILIKFNPVATFENGYHVDAVFTNTSGINAVKAAALKDAKIYNLNGQRVDKAQKGLYIVNGHKVVIK